MRGFFALVTCVCAVVGTLVGLTRSPTHAARSVPVAYKPVIAVPAPEIVLPIPEAAPLDLTMLHPPAVPPVYIESGREVEIPIPPRRRPFVEKPSLLAMAQAYIGKNPTGWRSLWCAKFVAMLAPELARKVPNPNLARAWAKLPKAARKPGAIVVLTRRGGGHIGVVKGFTKRGDRFPDHVARYGSISRPRRR